MLLAILIALLAAGNGLAAPKTSDVENVTSPVSTVYDLKNLYTDYQNLFLPIAPPSEKKYVHSDGSVLPVDWKRFPREFNQGMFAEMDSNGFPIYRVAVYEDVITRETVFLNAYGAEVYRLAPAKDYNPYAWQMDKFQIYTLAALESSYQWIYDPAHIAAEFQLIPEALYDDYQLVREAEAAEALLMAPMAMTMSLPETVTELRMGISNATNGAVQVEIAWPDGFSDRLEIFAATDLVARDWQLFLTNIITYGSSDFSWVDPSTNYTKRFYVTGNADLDTDADGLANAREKFLYSTDPSLNDTDGDGLIDGWELGYGLNPLIASGIEALGDPDGDGFSNLEEQKKGTAPDSADANPAIGTVATVRYYYDQDDRLTDCFVGTLAAEKAVPSGAHNLSETVSVQ